MASEQQDRDDAAQWDAVEEATELMLEGSYHDALVKLRDVIRDDPRNPYAFHYTGAALFELGQFEAAAAAYRAAVQIAPRYTGARVGLSHCLRIMDETRAAMFEARKALEVTPGDGDALWALGLAQAAAGDKTSAVRSMEAFLLTNPEFEVAQEAKAMIEKLLGRSRFEDDDEEDDGDKPN